LKPLPSGFFWIAACSRDAEETYKKNLNFPYDTSSLTSLILSYVHIDHIGNVSNLVEKGFQRENHCTLALADLANLLLLDSEHIHESDAAYINKKKTKRQLPLVGAFRAAKSFHQDLLQIGIQDVVVPQIGQTFSLL
jgi:Cft2 family RNA processing exonuclease